MTANAGSAQQRIEASFNYELAATTGKRFSLNVDLQLPGRGITAVFGHSGSGKTTLLRCIAGLEKAGNGQLIVNGELWQDATSFLPTHKRPLGFVFQESSLFSHLSAYDNLQYAMKRANPGKPSGLTRSSDSLNSKELLDHVVALMGIESILGQKPDQLSGGERQRVAVARALLIRPRLLLMDEPLASLDFARKQEILPYLEKLPEEFDIPIIYVSHSVEEVARLANHLVLLDNGKAVASSALADVLARFDLPIQLGEDSGVVLEAKVLERDHQWQLLRVGFAGGELWLRDGGEVIDQAIRIRILASDVSLSLQPHGDSSILNKLSAQVVELAGDVDAAMLLVRLQIGPDVVIARITRRSAEHLKIEIGSVVWAQIKSVAIVR